MEPDNMPLLDHNTNREATSFLLKKYNDFSVSANHPKIIKMDVVLSCLNSIRMS